MNKIEFYYREWKFAEKTGNKKYAKACKSEYRSVVMQSLKRPCKQYFDELKAFPPIWLN